jgi:hypothetical protein
MLLRLSGKLKILKRVSGCLIVVLAVLLISGAAEPAQAKDKIRILSITPDSLVTAGAEKELAVEIEYELDTKQEGAISLGFNTKFPESYIMGDEVVVTRGKED